MANKENIKNLINLIYLILNSAGVKLTEKEEEMLSFRRDQFNSDNSEQKKIITNIYENMIKGYLSLAVRGYLFTDLDRIKKEFGRSLKESYPEASEIFLKFASTYWTFKLYLEDLIPKDRLADFFIYKKLEKDPIAYSFLSQLEGDVAGLFFPTPGPITVPSDERERAQREVLKNFDIDIEDFMKGNPILIRDRRRGT